MSTKRNITIDKDTANKKITVTRDFDGPVEQVWKAWTESSLLDQWWAPRPWKARTKTMDFREGGHWLYAMVGPDGTEMWARVDYETIEANKSFTGTDSFCDENGNKSDMPGMHWNTVFSTTSTGTRVVVEITFADDASMNKILEMGFEEGFTSALGNLDELLAQ